MTPFSARLFSARAARSAPFFAALAALLLVRLDPGGFIDRLEALAWDERSRRFAGKSPQSDSIRVVEIGEETLERLAPVFGPWPWPRAAHAALLDQLRLDGVKAVGFDVVFPDRAGFLQIDERLLNDLGLFAENADVPEFREELKARLDAFKAGSDDALFTQAVRMTRVVVQANFLDAGREKPTTANPAQAAASAELFRRNGVDPGGLSPPRRARLLAPYPDLAQAAYAVGHGNLFAEADGAFRRAALLLGLSEGVSGGVSGAPTDPTAALPALPGLALALAGAALDVRPDRIRVRERTILLGDRAIPVAADGSTPIVWRGKVRTEAGEVPVHRIIPYETVLASAAARIRGETPPLPPGLFKDATVLVGVSAAGLGEARPTPFSTASPGLRVQAEILDALLAGESLTEIPPQLALTGTALFALLAGLAAVGLPAGWGAAAAASLGLGLALGNLFFFGRGFLGPVAAPLVALVLSYGFGLAYAFGRESREKAGVKAAFGRYVAPAVLGEILKAPESLRLGGVRREMTVLFSDLRGFTGLVETLSPEAVQAMLNAYFTRMTRCVSRTLGVVDKFVGDALMAEWNAPVPLPDHAARAIEAALLMGAELDDLNAERTRRGEPALFMRIGINTGEMIVGNMGSEDIFDYTVLGDEVNAASRLEPLNKLFGTRLIVSAATRERAESAAPGRFLFRTLGWTTLKGRKTPLAVSTVEGLAESVPTARRAALAGWERAVERLYAPQTNATGPNPTGPDEARQGFAAFLALYPDDKTAKLHLDRLAAGLGPVIDQTDK